MRLPPHARRNRWGYPHLLAKPVKVVHEPEPTPGVVRPFILAVVLLVVLRLGWYLAVLVCHGSGH